MTDNTLFHKTPKPDPHEFNQREIHWLTKYIDQLDHDYMAVKDMLSDLYHDQAVIEHIPEQERTQEQVKRLAQAMVDIDYLKKSIDETHPDQVLESGKDRLTELKKEEGISQDE